MSVSPMVEYLSTLTPEQMTEAIKLLSTEEKKKLTLEVLAHVQNLVEYVVTNIEDLELTSESPGIEENCEHTPGQFLHGSQCSGVSYYKCLKCKTAFPMKWHT